MQHGGYVDRRLGTLNSVQWCDIFQRLHQRYASLTQEKKGEDVGMKKQITIIILMLLMIGCAPTYFETLNENMGKNLNSCLGKLTEDALVMRASAPTEKVSVRDGEIWIYKYRKTDAKTTTTGTGGLLFPFESETTTYDYALDVRLRFNHKGILTDWRYKGHITAFDHPFVNLWCQ